MRMAAEGQHRAEHLRKFIDGMLSMQTAAAAPMPLASNRAIVDRPSSTRGNDFPLLSAAQRHRAVPAASHVLGFGVRLQSVSAEPGIDQ